MSNQNMSHSQKESAILCRATGFSWLDIVGPDAVKFLQGQSTIDCTSLEPQSLQPGGVCNPKGRLVANFFATKIETGIRLILRASLVEPLTRHLAKYKVFFRCEMQPSAAPETLFFCSAPLPGQSDSQAFWDAASASEQGRLGFQIVVRDSAENSHTDKDFQTRLSFYNLLIKSGFALFDGDQSEEFLPHELAFNHLRGVDYKKGCFTGQEIIARMHYKGKLKSHLCLLSLEQSCSTLRECGSADDILLASGQKLLREGKSVGFIVSAVPSTQGKGSLMLANLREEPQNIQIFQPDGENQPILKVTSITRIEQS